MLWELAIATVSVLAIAHILYAFRSSPWIYNWISVIVAVLFIYVPVTILFKMGRPIDFLDRDIHSFFKSILVFAAAALIVFPAFLVLAHFWQIIVFGRHGFKAATCSGLLSISIYQTVLIALPEEFFFRGYFQTTIDRVFLARRRVLGVDLGWGWIITAFVFAIGHTVVTYRWWHFSIFFPALLFGYLRLKTGSITAPVLFHATSNILMDWFARSYY